MPTTTKLSNFTALVGNTLWTLGGNFQFDFDVTPNSVEEVLQNIYEIFSVPLYSQPYLRPFGNDVSWIDAPGNVAQFQMQVAFLVAVSKWEPRAKFNKINFVLDAVGVTQGQYSLYVELEIDLTKQITTQLFAAPPASNIWVIDNSMNGSTLPSVQFEDLTI